MTTLITPTLDFIPRLFTLAGAVKYSGVCKAKLYAEKRAGKIQFTKIDGSTRIEREELDRYLNEKAKPAPAIAVV